MIDEETKNLYLEFATLETIAGKEAAGIPLIDQIKAKFPEDHPVALGAGGIDEDSVIDLLKHLMLEEKVASIPLLTAKRSRGSQLVTTIEGDARLRFLGSQLGLNADFYSSSSSNMEGVFITQEEATVETSQPNESEDAVIKQQRLEQLKATKARLEKFQRPNDELLGRSK